VIRKTARLSGYYHSKWFVLYVETPSENSDRIALDKQRHLINNFKLAVELGAEVIRLKKDRVTDGILEVTKEIGITTVCIGKPHLNLFKIILSTNVFNALLTNLSSSNIDLVILS